MQRFFYLIALFVLVGCSSNRPAPVTYGNSPVVVEGTSAAQSSDGRYIVKKGDNLYRIALNNNVSTNDLIAWNNLSDETRIAVGQELRVRAPDVEVRPIAGSTAITVVGESGTAGGSVGYGGVIREPRGGKIAYSDTALTQMRALDGGGSPTTQPAEPSTSVSSAAAGIDWTWPGAGKVIRGLGKSDSGEISRGIDITGRKGEPIQAAADGKVSYVGNLDKYGDFVVIRHDADYLSVYANTSKILVKKDQIVTKGQKIAEIGSSGIDHPKLHFEIRYKSQPVDPLELLPQRQ
jgi:lipoprotein NlpD